VGRERFAEMDVRGHGEQKSCWDWKGGGAVAFAEKLVREKGGRRKINAEIAKKPN